MHLGTDQDKMFERYAPIQRKVKPSVWKQAIQRALELPEGELPVDMRSQGTAWGRRGCSSVRSTYSNS